MEKIYQNNKDKYKQSFFKNQNSIFLSVVFGFVCIVGLITFGFRQISFAADEPVFQSKNGKEIIGVSNVEAGDIKFSLYDLYDEVQGGTLDVFCTEYMTEFVEGKVYDVDLDDLINEDPGLAYLVSSINEIFASVDERAYRWLGQTAVWTYMYEYESASVLSSNVERANYYKNIYDNAKNVHTLYSSDGEVILSVDPAYNSLYEQYRINDIIARARQKRNNGIFVSVHKTNDNISISDDNKYYMTSEINFSFSDMDFFNKYSVDISKTPKGTVLVDETGKEYEKDSSGNIVLSKFAPKVYVKVPVDSVTDENKKFDISVIAEYNFPKFTVYKADGSQRVITTGINAIMLGKKEVGFTIDLDYTPVVPNTGKMITRTIYFMGIIIILSGIGVVLANINEKKD